MMCVIIFIIIFWASVVTFIVEKIFLFSTLRVVAGRNVDRVDTLGVKSEIISITVRKL